MRWPWRKPVRERDAPAPPECDMSVFKRRASTPKWDYVSMSGPYRMVRCDDDDQAIVRYARIHDTLTDAIVDFSRLNHPRVGEVCLLIDGDDQALLSWWDTHHGEGDLRFGWAGCKYAFDLLAVIEPINSALWERLAFQEAMSCPTKHQTRCGCRRP